MCIRDSVGVVRRRDLDGAGPEFPIHIFVRHHGNRLVKKRQNDIFAHEMGIPFVLGMDGHRRISQHGLRLSLLHLYMCIRDSHHASFPGLYIHIFISRLRHG